MYTSKNKIEYRKEKNEKSLSTAWSGDGASVRETNREMGARILFLSLSVSLSLSLFLYLSLSPHFSLSLSLSARKEIHTWCGRCGGVKE